VVVHTGAPADATHSLTARASDTAGNTSDGDRLLADGRLRRNGKFCSSDQSFSFVSDAGWSEVCKTEPAYDGHDVNVDQRRSRA
jgi:hypothetical protein